MLGFFKVISNKVGYIGLQLPKSMKIYNSFYFNLLKKALTNSLTNQVNKLLLLFIINNKEK